MEMQRQCKYNAELSEGKVKPKVKQKSSIGEKSTVVVRALTFSVRCRRRKRYTNCGQTHIACDDVSSEVRGLKGGRSLGGLLRHKRRDVILSFHLL